MSTVTIAAEAAAETLFDACECSCCCWGDTADDPAAEGLAGRAPWGSTKRATAVGNATTVGGALNAAVASLPPPLVVEAT